jgi:hypothetical protein
VTANNSITSILGNPLSPDWTVEGLAEQVLGTIAAQGTEDAQEFVLDADATADRQSRRLLRPLLACLATKSAAETGTAVNLYEGQFSFKRQGPNGPVWIFGHFENRPGNVRVVLRRSDLPPEQSASHARHPTVLTEQRGQLLPQTGGVVAKKTWSRNSSPSFLLVIRARK